MRVVPDYRRSDGNRTKIGDRLVSMLPGLFRSASGWNLAMMGARDGHSFVRKVLVQPNPYGYRFGRLLVQKRPWGMSKSVRFLGLYWGKP